MTNRLIDDQAMVAGFEVASDRERRGESANLRVRASLRDLAVSLGLSESEVDRHVEDYMDGSRRAAALDSMIRSHDLENKRVLEVGSGLGGSLLHLCGRGIDVTGVEPGDDWLDIMRQRLAESGFDENRAMKAAGEALPFSDEAFDFVFSQQVLEHVRDPAQVVREIYRVLRPGGEVLITAPNYLSFSENHYRVAWLPGMPTWLGAIYLRLRGRDPGFYRKHVNNLTYLQVIRAVKSAGLENVILDRHLLEWAQRSPQKYSMPKRVFLGVLSLFGSRALIVLYHMRYLLKDEITYICRKPAE